MEIASSRGRDLTRGGFVMAVQRRLVQYLDYLQGILLFAHHGGTKTRWDSWKALCIHYKRERRRIGKSKNQEQKGTRSCNQQKQQDKKMDSVASAHPLLRHINV